MGSADDDKQRSVGLLEDLLEAPGESMAAAAVIDVRNECRPQLSVRFLLIRQSGAVFTCKEPLHLLAQQIRNRIVTAKATGFANRVGQLRSKSGPIKKQALFQLIHQ